MVRKRLEIDACVGSQLRDTQGETLSVEGADISELEAGRGKWNDNHGKGFFNSLGRVTHARKIFKQEDCESDREKYYWEKVKSPYIYAKGYLYDDDDHSNARACGAILRNIHKTDAPLKIKASVEGGVVARGLKDPSILARTKIHSVALTFTPANNATLVEPVNIEKSSNEEADMALIKSVMHLAQDNVPSFRHITRNASAQKIIENIDKIQELADKSGLDIKIQELSAEKLVKKAIINKISTNIKKINDLVKVKPNFAGLTPTPNKEPSKNVTQEMELLPQKVTGHRKEITRQKRDVYEQNVGKLKTDPTTPAKPKAADISGGAQPLLTGAKLKTQNTLKRHASKAMKDDKYLLDLGKDLIGKGVEKHRIKKIIEGIQEHMTSPTDEKLERNDKVNHKAVIGKLVRNVALTAALATAAHQFKPEGEVEAAKPKEVKITYPPLHSVGRGYVGKIKEFEDDKKKIKKALTAGYGGAGTPTGNTGGGVFQAEALDKDFKYITCESCGKEQVHSGNQVRCRECGKGFSLEKIFSFMSKNEK